MSIPLRVLVVESSEARAALYLREIESAGYELLVERAFTREDLSSALDVGPWEAILMGTETAGLPWADALEELRMRDLDTPFLLIAPDPFNRDAAVRAVQAGAHDYIRESDLSRLLPALARALREAGLRRSTREADLVVRESEERFRLLVEGVRDYALFMLDTDGRVASWNAGAQRLHGYFAAEIIGRPYTCFYASGDKVSVMPEEELDRASQRGRVEREGWRVRKDGSQFWAHVVITALHDERGRLRGFSKLTRDITEHKRAQTALLRAQTELREVVQKIPDGVGICREGRLVYVNPAFAAYLGCQSPDELAGEALLDLVDEADRDRAAARMHGTEPPELASSSTEIRYHRRDGATVTLEVAPAQAIEFEGAHAYLFVARDVSEQKRMQARLLLADRMASVGTLAAGVAHEINNPLAYVIANVELVAGELMALGLDVPALLAPLPATSERAVAEERLMARLREMEQTLHEAQEGTERVRQITRDLKTFSRADEERRTAVDLTRVLDASINMAWNEIRHRARLVKTYGRVPPVEANEARIGQVFLNLLINAAQAVPEGAADKNEIRVTTQMEGADRVRIDVIDTGTGISPESMTRIFDPFFTTKPVGVGTGLGLSICHGIVTQLGGEILVKSEVGKGSVFSVVLRVARSSVATTRGGAEPTRTGRRGRVLVVDDEVMIGTAIRRTLASEHDVIPLTSAREALDRITAGERFDVVLCDLMMPIMSGMDLYDELCRLAPEQARRVVFLTGGAFTPRGQAFLDQVPNPRLDKPFDNQSLRTLVRDRVRWQGE